MTDPKFSLIQSQTPVRYNSMSQRLSPMITHPSTQTSDYLTSTPVASDIESGVERDTTHTGYSSLEDPIISNTEDHISNTDLSDSQEDLTTGNRELRALLQAAVFIEDSIEHRSIIHRVDTKSLERYRLYHSKPVRWAKRFVVALLLSLAFLENPSSVTISSDPGKRGERYEFPCGIIEVLELLCLLVLTADLVFRAVMVGSKTFRKSNWLIACALILLISYMDWFVSIGYLCKETYRIRRILRPFFLIQNSSLMKKTVQSIQQTIPQVLSVLFLMTLHVYFFTMLGMVLFTPNTKNIPKRKFDKLFDEPEGEKYFKDLGRSIMSVIVLLTTANNPDVMMPAYSDNRLFAVYFILFLVIGMYFFMNVLLAVIYNQFKGSFTKSMQSSFMRRRVGIRAAFEVLRGSSFYQTPLESPSSTVDIAIVKSVINIVQFSKKHRYKPVMMEYLDRVAQTGEVDAHQFRELFDIVFQDSIKKRHPCRQFEKPILRQVQALLLHNYFQYFGDFVSLVNVFIVTIELAMRNAFSEHSILSIFNFCFIFYFAVEQILMIYFIGPKRYFSHKNVWFESVVTWLLVILEILCIGFYGGPFPYLTESEIISRSKRFSPLSLFNILRIMNMLVIIRLLRIIPSIKPLSMVASTLVDLLKNMRAFGGIVIFIFYVFGILGLVLFEGSSPQPPTGLYKMFTTDMSDMCTNYKFNITCGSYEQLGYYANNFDDFASSLVVLWDVLVVNNWFVFLEAYDRKSRYTQIYFISWWLISVVLCINLFVALVIEAFITQWERQINTERKHKKRKYAHTEETSRHFRVHDWFRANYHEPKESEILAEINKNHYLRKYTLHTSTMNLED